MAEQGTSEAPLPAGYRVQEFLPDNWCWDMQGENGEWVGDGSHFATEEGAVVGAWQDYADTLEQIIAATIDPKLAEFYQVNTVAELLAAQEEHILKLQDSARRNVKPWEDTFPPTLLPKYLRDTGLAHSMEAVAWRFDYCGQPMLQFDKPTTSMPTVFTNVRPLIYGDTK